MQFEQVRAEGNDSPSVPLLFQTLPSNGLRSMFSSPPPMSPTVTSKPQVRTPPSCEP